MLSKNLSAVLCLVLVYVSVTTSRPTAEEIEIEYNVDNIEKQLAVDGHLYNPNPTERGLIGGEISPRQDFSYLGSFNGKSWYIERTKVNYAAAVQGCITMGMVLAKTNQAELNFLYTVTSSSDDYSWLGGKLAVTIESFRWTDGSTPSGVSLDTTYDLALTLSRYSTTTKLTPYLTNTSRYYICTI